MKNSPSVIFEDNHLLVIRKPAGWLSQGDRTGDQSVVDWAKEYIRKKHNKPGNIFCGLPHRLDRPVSGVMVLAKTSKSLERLNKMFQENEVKKVYYALVEKAPELETDCLTHWLLKDPNENVSKAYVKEKKNSKKSVLNYSVLSIFKGYSLVEVHPQTGRPHQIRVQLAAIGSPILGDKKYGARKLADYEGEIALHAGKISFIHPVKKEKVVFEAPLNYNRFMENYQIVKP